MKKINTAFFATLLLLVACKKEETTPETFSAKNLLAGKEVVEIEETDFPDLADTKDGEMTLQIISSPNEIYYANGPRYSFAGSVTTSNAVSIDISSSSTSHTFTFAAGNPGQKSYSTLISETANPTYLSAFFEKNVTFQVNDGVAATPIQGTLYAPKPIVITAPVYNPTVVNAWNITSAAIFTWVPDPTNRNEVLVRVKNETTGTRTLLLTPDDGSLKFSDIAAYAPSSGEFEVALGRINYITIPGSGSKEYRVIIKTMSYNHYNLTI